MSVVNVPKSMNGMHPRGGVLFKVGKFYISYGKDAYIISYLFDFKVNHVKNNISVCEFPKKVISKTMAKLENCKINYILVDTKNSYDVDDKMNYKNLNEYEKCLEKAVIYIRTKRRIDKINEMLMKDINEEEIKFKLEKIEAILYENGEI